MTARSNRALWEDTAPPPPATAPLAADAACDVAIIGAGIFGLNAALVLARAGRAVVVIDAGGIGAGASGRNGGLVVPSLPRIGPGDVGPSLAALVAGAAAATFRLIEAEGIACDAARTGWLHPAHAGSLVPAVQARVAAWRDAGAACVWLDAAETRRRLGSPHVHGALFDPTGGHLDPMAYVRGLARAVLAAGGVIHTGTQVQDVAPHGRSWRVATPHGNVTASRVLQCTNGQAPGLGRPASVPLTVHQMASAPLPDAVRAAVLPGNEAFSDTRNNLLACRWTAGGRLVTGAMASIPLGAAERLRRRAAVRLAALFPALAGIVFERVWSGRASLTGDFRPHLYEPAPGWLMPIACNGRGVALCTVLGQAVARAMLDQGPMPLPVTPPRRMAALAALVPRALLPIGDWQDRHR